MLLNPLAQQLPPFWNVVFGCHEAAMREMNRQPAPEGQDKLELFIHYYQAIADHAGWEEITGGRVGVRHFMSLLV